MRVIGFDPGYTKCGVVAAEFDEDGYHIVEAAIIYPDRKSQSKSLEKVEVMCWALEDFKALYPDFFEADLLIIEAQQHYAKNMNQFGRNRTADSAIGNTLIRMGKVSGVFWGLVDAPEKHFVLPRTWNKGRSKDLNKDRILKCLTSAPSEWEWVGGVPKKSDWEHAIDAAGLSIWGYESFLVDSKTPLLYNVK